MSCYSLLERLLENALLYCKEKHCFWFIVCDHFMLVTLHEMCEMSFHLMARMIFISRQRSKDFLLRARVVYVTSNMSPRRLADTSNKFDKVRACVPHVQDDYYFLIQPTISSGCVSSSFQFLKLITKSPMEENVSL